MAQVDRGEGLVGTLGVKAPCKVATTAAITLYGLQTIDGIAVIDGDRVLVKNQADPIENGIWYAAVGVWYRAPDFDGIKDISNGTLVVVASGASSAGFLYRTVCASGAIPSVNAINFTPQDITSTGVAAAIAASLLTVVGKTSNTGSALMPNGNTAQRDASPVFGATRANTTLTRMEWWDGSAWVSMGSGATGGGVDTAFQENDVLVTADYTIGQGSLSSGVTVVAGTDLFTLVGSNYTAGQLVQFSSTTTLPAPLVAATGYYVIASGLTADTFKVSTTLGGAALDITTTGTGTHSVGRLKNAVSAGPVTIADAVLIHVPTNATWSIT